MQIVYPEISGSDSKYDLNLLIKILSNILIQYFIEFLRKSIYAFLKIQFYF